MIEMLKRIAPVLPAALLLAALVVPLVHADRTYTLCDPAKSTLCSGLVALYEFNETASDTLRRSEVPASPLVEVSRVNTAQTASGKLGYALSHVDIQSSDGLTITRTQPFGGEFTFGFWIYVETGKLPSANGKKVPIFWMAPIVDSTGAEFMPNNSVWPGSSSWAPPVVYLYNSSGTTYVRYEVKQSMTETVSYVQSAQAISAATWYYVSLGQYGNASSTYPYQRTIWIAAGTNTFGTRTVTNLTRPDFAPTGHFMIAGMPTTGSNWEYGAFRLDQFGVWGRYLMDSELTTVVNGGSGRAYPFY
jgi:hypothetical protein